MLLRTIHNLPKQELSERIPKQENFKYASVGNGYELYRLTDVLPTSSVFLRFPPPLCTLGAEERVYCWNLCNSLWSSPHPCCLFLSSPSCPCACASYNPPTNFFLCNTLWDVGLWQLPVPYMLSWWEPLHVRHCLKHQKAGQNMNSREELSTRSWCWKETAVGSGNVPIWWYISEFTACELLQSWKQKSSRCLVCTRHLEMLRCCAEQARRRDMELGPGAAWYIWTY